MRLNPTIVNLGLDVDWETTPRISTTGFESGYVTYVKPYQRDKAASTTAAHLIVGCGLRISILKAD